MTTATDQEILAFVYWCRINSVEIVTDVHVVRRVMASYRITKPPRRRKIVTDG